MCKAGEYELVKAFLGGFGNVVVDEINWGCLSRERKGKEGIGKEEENDKNWKPLILGFI